MTYGSGKPIKMSRRGETLGLVRYADDFVVLHHDKAVLFACYKELEVWLSRIGLKLSVAKTRLTHSLELQPGDVEDVFDRTIGFNFLGYTIKQFKSKYNSYKSTTGEKLGYKTLLYPSSKSISAYQAKLHKIMGVGALDGKGTGQEALIAKLNPIIRGWASYFGAFDSNTMHFLTKMDYLMYLKLRHWAKRVTGTCAKGNKFFITVGKNKWTFGI